MNKIFILLILIGLFGQCSNNLTVNNMNDGEILMVPSDNCFPDVKDKYIYPAVTKNMTPLDKINLSQLPDNILKTISTAGLIRSFLDIPDSLSNRFLLSSSSPSETWYRIYEQFNSVQELLKRENAAKVLINYYENIRFDCCESDVSILAFSIKLASLEFLFSKQEILSQMDHKDKRKLVSLLLLNYRRWQELSVDYYYISGIIPVMAIVMYNDQYLPLVLYYSNEEDFNFVKQGYALDKQVPDILLFAEDFIKN